MAFLVRDLAAADVPGLLRIISDCRREYGLEGRVPCLLEAADYAMYDLYRQPRSRYFVAEIDGMIVGGGGVAPLERSDSSVCELQRMYLQPTSRGLGHGTALIDACMQAAQLFRFAQCYAETISEMTTAIAFYERHGFRRLTEPRSGTGHSHNNCWLIRELQN